MATTVLSILREVQQILQDESGIRWPAPELAEHLNDGQREVASLRPDMMTTAAALALVAGAKQALPSNCSKLIEIPRNTSGKSVRQIDRNMLDAIEPSWYTRNQVVTIDHFTHDPRDPLVFYVYPPAAVGASLDLIYSALPTDVAVPSGPAWTTATGNISVNDIFKNALLNWCLFRAYSKDAEFGGNATSAAAFYQLFRSALVDETTPRNTVKPTVTDLPQ